jgi:hypothetical protein
MMRMGKDELWISRISRMDADVLRRRRFTHGWTRMNADGKTWGMNEMMIVGRTFGGSRKSIWLSP